MLMLKGLAIANCLGQGHCTRDCRSSSGCKKCGKNHHTCLHKDSSSAAPTTDNAAASNTVVINSVTSQVAPENSSCLLMTSQVVINPPNGKQVVARALLGFWSHNFINIKTDSSRTSA